LPWKDEEFTRPRSELLAAARRRGEQLRQRRRLAYGLAVPAVLLVVAIPAALALNGEGGRPTTVAASGGGTVTTMSTTTSTAAPTTTEVPAPTSLVPPPTVAVRVTSTTSRPVTTEPATTVLPTTTTTTPDIGPCDRSKFTLSRPTTDKASYWPGEEIVVRSTLAFNVTKPCGSAVSTRSLKVLDASGKEVFGLAVVVDYISQPIHAPGETEVIQHRWSQVSFVTNSQAAPGTYTLVMTADELQSPAGSVQLVAG
jgi:hypothetical protein